MLPHHHYIIFSKIVHFMSWQLFEPKNGRNGVGEMQDSAEIPTLYMHTLFNTFRMQPMNDILWGTVSVRPTHPLQILTTSIHKCTWTVKGRWKLSLLWGIKKAGGLSPGWNDALPYLTHKEAGRLPWMGNNMTLYNGPLETISPECQGFDLTI